jgi:translation initiation factor IF-2
MPKQRVYQLAKELKVQSALILELLDRLGKEVKSDLSSLDAETADAVREKMVALLEREKERLAEEAELEKQRIEEEKEDIGEEEPAAETPEVPAAELPVAAAPAEPVAPQQEPAIAAAPTSATAAGVPAPTPEAPKRRVFPARRLPPGATLPADSKRKIPPAAPVRPAAPRPGAPPRTAPPRGVPGRPGVGGPHPVAGRPVPPRPAGIKPRRKKKEKRPDPKPARPKPELPPVPEEISLSEAVTVKELAEKLNRKSKDVIAKLLTRGVLANINQPLDPEVAVEVAQDFGSTATVLSFEEETQKKDEVAAPIGEAQADRPEDLKQRPPVVTVMGHVDHGKTSLLDSIRVTNVVAREHGGITQHIGAYQVEKKGRRITFLDTPGHEAFTMMRARGAKATDIVILVVAADDGVKPQTVEAIDHAKAAGVPIVVAINKIDKPDSRPDRVKQQLADRELMVEEYGGQVVSVEVSAKKGTGIDDLLEMLLLVADLHEYKANPDKHGTGVVLETKLDRARGIISTVLVQEGTVKVGEPFIAGSAFGRVRAMNDEFGHRVTEAGPSTPVEIMGFASEPQPGDTFQSVADEGRARQIAGFRRDKARAVALQKTSRHVTLESLSREVAESGTVKELPILLNGDAQGSLEAIQKSLSEIESEKVKLNILRTSVGPMTQADVLLASASDAIIVGFNVRPDRAAAELAKQEDVEIRLYTVIYEVRNEIEQAMVGILEPELREQVLGQAEVRQLFKVPKVGTVAGCYITDGKVARSASVRLLRDNVVIYTGNVGSLRRFKEDIGEVKQGFECGIGIANYNDLKEGDVIEFFVTEKVAVKSL